MTNVTAGRHWLSRLAAALAAFAAVFALASGPAGAQVCYPVGGGSPECTAPSLTVSDDTLFRGESFQAVATGYAPGSTVTFTIESVEQTLGTAVADQTGRAVATLTIPTNFALGPHTVRSRGTGINGQPLVLSRPVTVIAQGGNDGGDGDDGDDADGTTGSGTDNSKGDDSLAKTGAVVVPTVVVGVGLVAGGLVLRQSARRRKTATA